MADSTLRQVPLSMLDLNDNRRVQGAHVDIGAYEFIPDPLFQNGFE